MIKKTISTLLIVQLLLPSLALARDKSSYRSKRCGQFNIITDVESSEGVYVCREDSGVMDDGYKTLQGRTLVHTSAAIANSAKNSSKIIDEILLIEVKKRAEKKLQLLNPIEKLPENEETQKLKAQVARFKSKILDSSKGAIHQIRTILSLYPDIEDDLIKEHPEYEPLICKYEVWKHKKEVLSKIAITSSKIMSYLLIAAAPLGGVAFFGFFSLQTFGSILVGLGIAQSSLAGFELATTIGNWDDVRAGALAKKGLAIDKSLKDYIRELQKEPHKNQEEILKLQTLLLSNHDAKDLKDLKKLKNQRVKQVVASSLKMIIGAATIKGGLALKAHFKDFKTTAPAESVNPSGGTGSNPIPGSGGNDNGGGFLGDDGG